MKKSTWYFIDIDGCIMPSSFSNVFYKNDEEKLETINRIYNKVVKEETKLFPGFVKFYEKINNIKLNPIEEITFITGRQENVFGWLTEMQLKPLNLISSNYDVRYFYNKVNHTKENYKNFKLHEILNIISFTNFKGIIEVFDDTTDYFDGLIQAIPNLCLCTKITSNYDWIQHLK